MESVKNSVLKLISAYRSGFFSFHPSMKSGPKNAYYWSQNTGDSTTAVGTRSCNAPSQAVNVLTNLAAVTQI